MAKAVKVFFGTDTYGRSVERAQREDGVWFARFMEFNGYGKSMCKWYQDEPTYSTETENAYTGEIIKHDPIMMWGWNKMNEYPDVKSLRYRLPNC